MKRKHRKRLRVKDILEQKADAGHVPTNWDIQDAYQQAEAEEDDDADDRFEHRRERED